MGLPQIFSRNGQCTISINCKEAFVGAAQPDNILDAQNENQYVNAQLIDAMYSEKWKNKLLIEGVLLPDWGY